MSSSTILGFASSFFILFFVSNVDSLVRSNPLIDQACSEPRLVSEKTQCIQILQTQPNISSATNQFDLSVAIMQSGISSAATSRDYVEGLIEKSTNPSPDSKAALQECKSSFDSSVGSFNSALSEVKNDKEYMTATYDLLIGTTDAVQRCQDNIASRRISDVGISNGIRDVTVLGFSAYQAVSRL